MLREAIGNKLVKYTAGSTLVMGMIATNVFMGNFEATEGLTMDGGEGSITNIQPIKIPYQCTSTFDAELKNVRTKYDLRIESERFNIDISTLKTRTQEFNGSLTTDICNKPVEATVQTKGEGDCKNVMCIEYPEDMYLAKVQPTNPLVDAPKTVDNGITEAIAANAANALRAIPFFEATTGNDALEVTLNGFTMLSAYRTAAEECGAKKAWPVLRVIEERQAQETAAMWGERWTDEAIDPESIKVTIPEKISLTDQYDEKALAAAAGVDDMKLSGGKLGVCKDSPQLEKLKGQYGVTS